MTEPKHTADELRQWQALPLNVKILMTQERIRHWVRYFGEDGVCVSFSGGKDSTVLLDIVRKMYPDVKAVFSNTGLEYPEIQRFVREHENVDVITPEMRFPEVLTKYGYPLIGKEVAEAIYYARKLRGGQRSGRSEPNFKAKEAGTQRRKNQLISTSTAANRRTVLTGKMGGWKETDRRRMDILAQRGQDGQSAVRKLLNGQYRKPTGVVGTDGGGCASREKETSLDTGAETPG